MNMQAFADVFAVYMNPYALGDIPTTEFVCWSVNHVLAGWVRLVLTAAWNTYARVGCGGGRQSPCGV